MAKRLAQTLAGIILAGTVISLAGLFWWKIDSAFPQGDSLAADKESYAELETTLAPLSKKLGPPQSGDWLAEHHETGQTFKEYLAEKPVRRDKQHSTIYIWLIGDFTNDQ